MIEKVINGVLATMAECLTDDQLRKLENTLVMQLHGLKVEEECTELVVSERHWGEDPAAVYRQQTIGELRGKYLGEL